MAAQVIKAARGTYRMQFESLRSVDDQRTRLIEDLLEDLEQKAAALEKAELDLGNEQEARRRFQQEALASKEQGNLWNKRSFVVLLIDADADGYVFQDRFISRGAKGGEDAADVLLGELDQFVRTLEDGSNGMDIFVRAFANLSGLATSLVRDGRLREELQLREFAAEFSSRQAFFDFVDVGRGKERADHKIRDTFKFFVESPQCKHILLACCHDSGYAPMLGQYVANKPVSDRITLLEGTPLPPGIRSLPFKRAQFTSVFTQPSIVKALGQGGTNKLGLPQPLAPPNGSPAAPFLQGSGRSLISTVMPSSNGINPSAQFERLGPVLIDEAGNRYDKPLQLPQSGVGSMKIARLCFYYYLRGECTTSNTCRSNHRFPPPLTDAQFDSLWFIARQQPCFVDKNGQSGGCSDPKCFYGHSGRMPQGVPSSDQKDKMVL